MAFSFEFVDNGKSFNINFENQEYTAGKNDVELLIADKATDEILEIRSNSAQFTDIKVNVVTDTITGIGAGSSTATQLRDALEAIFFLDEGSGGGSGNAMWAGSPTFTKTGALNLTEVIGSSVYYGTNASLNLIRYQIQH